jgi:hypothetical protein
MRKVKPIGRIFIGLAPAPLLPLAALTTFYWYDYSFWIVIVRCLLLQLPIYNYISSSVDPQMAFGGNTEERAVAWGWSGFRSDDLR